MDIDHDLDMELHEILYEDEGSSVMLLSELKDPIEPKPHGKHIRSKGKAPISLSAKIDGNTNALTLGDISSEGSMSE
jgi:hypothetical protein